MVPPIVQLRRRVTRQSIEFSPIEVVVTRKEMTDDGAGGKKPVDVVLEPQTMRLFLSRMPSGQETRAVGGRWQVSRAGLLAEHGADIKPGDEFEHEGVRYRVEWVDRVRFQGHVVSVQADLEVLG